MATQVFDMAYSYITEKDGVVFYTRNGFKDAHKNANPDLRGDREQRAAVQSAAALYDIPYKTLNPNRDPFIPKSSGDDYLHQSKQRQAAASRKNGKRGGRPRKHTNPTSGST